MCIVQNRTHGNHLYYFFVIMINIIKIIRLVIFLSAEENIS